MVMVFTILAVYDVIHLKVAPKPSHFIGAFIVFLVLEFVAQFGSEAARFAMYFGMLYLIALLVVIPAADGKPRGIMLTELAAWLTGKQVGGGTQGQDSGSGVGLNIGVPDVPPPLTRQGQPRKMRAG
jgi:chromate transport protein ChrA